MAKKSDSNDRRKRINDIKSQQKKAERRTTYAFVAVAVLLAGGLITAAVLSSGGGGLLDITTLGEKKAGAKCGEVEVAATPPGGQHVDAAVQYPTTPPTGGDHSSLTAPGNRHFYDKDEAAEPERLVHNLEHGYVVVWYDDQASDADINLLRQIGKNIGDAGPRYGRKFIVAPYTRGNFAEGNNIGIAAWGASQVCEKVSGEVIKEFVTDFRGPDGKKSVAPEKAVA